MRRFACWKTALLTGMALALFAGGVLTGANKFAAPSSIVHVVTVQWTSDSTPDQRKKALEGVKTMAAEIPGIKNVWIKSIKVQPSDYQNAFVMEFESQAAFDKYADHPAHKAWEKIYLPVREESRTHDITN